MLHHVMSILPVLLMHNMHMCEQLQAGINVQEFVLELLEETRMYENNKKV